MTRARFIRAGLLAFLAAFVTLFVQVLVHRLISAKLLNNYAFLVISLTMLGFAFSGILLTRWLEPLLARWGDALSGFAAAFVLSLLGATWLFYRTPGFHMIPPERSAFLAAFLRSMPFALLFAVPFVFVGLILGVLLSARDLPTPRVYFCDLVGSALGAFAVLPAIRHLGVELSLVLACGLLLLGTVALAPPRDRRVRLLAGTAALAILFAGVVKERVFKMVYPVQSTLWLFEQFGPPFGVEYVAWDPVSRIELSRIPTPGPITSGHPSLIGSNREFHQHFRRMLTQNNYAYTFALEYDGRRESLTGIEETLYASAYHATSVPQPKVAVIGVGGGFDVLTALFFEASRVEAVEINAATVEIVTSTFADYFRPWVEDPRVELVAAEGRHHLTASDERFDVLQLSGVDSYSGTAGAAHVFSESYLYTEEAWDLYLSRLTDAGIVCMIRLELNPPREMLRAVTTAVAALRRSGVSRPADHVITLTESNFSMTALLVKKTPFTREEEQRVAQWAEGNEYLMVSAGPSINRRDGNNYQRFLSLTDTSQEARFIASVPFDISPVGDDRPFFFKYSFWWHLWSNDPLLQRWAPIMELSIVLLLALVGLVTCVCVALPLRYLARRGAKPPGTGRYGVFFAGCGIGFMAVEIALLQKFGLFLGHPNYALSVVLAALLVSSGIGSLISRRTLSLLGGLRYVSFALCLLLLAMRSFVFPLLPEWIAWPLAGRIAFVFATILPIGVCLGAFVPTGLEHIKRAASAYTPWAWGINGIFSVMGPILAIAFSVTWGNTALLLLAVPIYLAVGFALPESPHEAIDSPAPEPA